MKYCGKISWDSPVQDLIIISQSWWSSRTSANKVSDHIKSDQDVAWTKLLINSRNILNFRAIALKCGIIKQTDDHLVLEGKEFNRLIRDADGNVSGNIALEETNFI